MSKEDYREKIEEHRQSIEIEKPNSRQSRSRVAKNKKPRRRDPLMTILTVIFIFIPLVILVYVWGFYKPTTPSQAQTKEEESLEYEKNDKIEDEETIIDEPVLIDDTVDENKEEDDESEVEESKDNQTSEEDTTYEKPSSGQVQDEESKGNKHVVKTGDTLFSIANANNTTVDAIMEANGLQTPDIQVGQQLIIP
ncbi:LysM peptidoglycan-binding domain-containing protein [Ureibacillus sp. MALMAid1270]|uniref:LysM peptidoglycan-binding domain-containing protein n=1 Tax=Ureibacillus sp. MALMAid1270 TaxID=3411629 RepID=UPI003BA5592F